MNYKLQRTFKWDSQYYSCYESTKGSNATGVNGGPSVYGGGINGSWAKFTGNDACVGGTDAWNADFNITTGFWDGFDYSYCFWMNASSTGTYQHVWNLKSGDGATYGGNDDAGVIVGKYGSGAGSYVLNGPTTKHSSWTHICLVYNNSEHVARVYSNGTFYAAAAATAWNCGGLCARGLAIGSWFDGTAEFYTGGLDEMYFWNRTLNASEVAYLQTNFVLSSNGTFPQSASEAAAPATGSAVFAVFANDSITYASLSSYIIEVDGTNISTTNGTVITSLHANSTTLHNLTAWCNLIGGYYQAFKLNYNVSLNYTFSMIPLFSLHDVRFQDVVNYAGNNYSRTLRADVNASCPSIYQTSVARVINGTATSYTTVSCTNASQWVNLTYAAVYDGAYNIYIRLNTSHVPEYNNNKSSGNHSIIGDASDPTPTNLMITLESSIGNTSIKINGSCVDRTSPLIMNNISHQGVAVYGFNVSNNTVVNKSVTPGFGTNVATLRCADWFGTASANYSLFIFLGNLTLIDEKDNTFFDVTNITSARAYFDDNSTYWDFKIANSSSAFYVTAEATRLRVELGYESNVIIMRYIDLSIVNESVRVCANKQGVTHYEQLVVSSSINPVVVQNVYSNCTVGADSTRFAYKDSYILKVYTIDSLYYLYVFDDGQKVYLASVDGSVQAYYNIDTLQFAQQTYDLSIAGEGVSWEPVTNTTSSIHYYNMRGDNAAVNFSIYDTRTNTLVFTQSSFTNLNNFTVLFDFSTLNATNASLFKIVIDKTSTSGAQSTIEEYFGVLSKHEYLKTGGGIALVILLLLFGLTLTATKFTFGWFGIVIDLVALAILVVTESSVYTTYLLVVVVIMLIWKVIILSRQNYPTVV